MRDIATLIRATGYRLAGRPFARSLSIASHPP